MEPTFPPPQPPRHGIAELLALLDGIRAAAFDRTLSDGDVARRVGDLLTWPTAKHHGEAALREHDGEVDQ